MSEYTIQYVTAEGIRTENTTLLRGLAVLFDLEHNLLPPGTEKPHRAILRRDGRILDEYPPFLGNWEPVKRDEISELPRIDQWR